MTASVQSAPESFSGSGIIHFLTLAQVDSLKVLTAKLQPNYTWEIPEPILYLEETAKS